MTNYNYTAKLIRDPLKHKSDDWQEAAHHWLVTINGQSFDYYTGVAHREMRKGLLWGEQKAEYKRLTAWNVRLNEYGWQRLLELTKATPPKLDDVLYSLVMDSSACEESFDDWCANYGYDTDSRKALESYLACQESAAKLRKAGVDIAAERERLQEY
jgi:hypothetical protein